jgi:hypothetical protein
VVSESCYSGGMGRTDHGVAPDAAQAAARRVVMRGADLVARAVAEVVASCIGEPPRDSDEIRASVLMLTASAEQQTAKDGVFTRCLLAVWQNGAFEGRAATATCTAKSARW